jgi:hypothetical protein
MRMNGGLGEERNRPMIRLPPPKYQLSDLQIHEHKVRKKEGTIRRRAGIGEGSSYNFHFEASFFVFFVLLFVSPLIFHSLHRLDTAVIVKWLFGMND